MDAMSEHTTQQENTFPKLLLRNSEKWPTKTAIRVKDLGIWQSWTWSEVREQIKTFAAGLKKLGVTSGDKVAIIGANRPKLYWSTIAVQTLGGIPVPVYSDAVANEMAYVLEHAEVKVAVCEDQEQVDKVLSAQDQLKQLQHIIYDEERGLQDYDHSHVHAFTEIQKLGIRLLTENSEAEQNWLDFIQNQNSEDVAVILYTSGTTGNPKGVLLTYDNLVWSAEYMNKFNELTEADEILAYLPPAWVGDHIFSTCQSYQAGYCVNCPESPETVTVDRREIAPTYFFAPPRVFESMLTMIMVQMEDASRLKRWIFNYFMSIANQFGEKILNGQEVSFINRVLYSLGDFFVYGPLRNRMGFSKMRVGYTAGEAIGPEIFKFYRSLGLNLKQLFGQTEGSVFIAIQPDGEVSADTVGPPFPSVEVKISDNGEVLYRSPGVFKSYFKNEEATKNTRSDDGWVKTGDAGFFTESGHLKIIDRANDVGKLKNGALFAPKYLENKLKFFPNIKEAVAFGHEQEYCAAFINFDLVSVSNWAERNNISYSGYQELATHPQVYDMIATHVDQVNQDLAAEPQMADSQIKRFLILLKELDADDGELTRTQKVRRKHISSRYEPLISALYDGSTSTKFSTEVTFEDGRKGVLEGNVEIRDVKIYPSSSATELKEAA